MQFSRHNSRATSAFTLLELLLATAVAAIVLLVINGTFFSALRLHNTTHDKIDYDLTLQRTLGVLRKDFAGILLPANPQATTYKVAGQLSTDANSTNDLELSAERITPDLYTASGTVDGWTPYGEVQMVAYYLAPPLDGAPNKDLVRVVTRNMIPAAEPIAEQQRLLTNVVSAAISYYDGAEWVDTWDSATTSTLPNAIKFSLVLAPRDGSLTRSDAAPVELVVPVLVKTSTTAQQEAAASSTGL